ncbi:large ribosomal subunit protein bL12c-like [Bidens hawaiensis]|uniref:large ribosomal subunit protein bL12c-like n=1 Tax=Bidens hawaiensis TaxID=980011 RepID=UPI00404A8782
MASSSTLSTVTLRAFSYPPRATTTTQCLSPKQTLEFGPKLTHRSTFLRPVAAVAEEKVVQLGDDISNLTLAQAQSLVEYLQDKLGVTAASSACFQEMVPDVVVLENLSLAILSLYYGQYVKT